MDFQKRMTGFYMHSVCLPEEVTKHFSDLVGKLLKFRRPDGDTWQVGLIGMGNKLVLQPGWSDFASCNNVLQNDLLFFKLVSRSTFEVRIFDSYGWENGGDFKVEVDEFEVQEDNMSCYISKKRSWSQNCNSLPLRKRLKISDCCTLCQEEEKIASKEVYGLPSEKKEELLENYQNETTIPVDCGMLINYTCGAHLWQAMSVEQKARANRLALKIQAGNPAFLCLLQQSCLTRHTSITVPKEFFSKHLQEGNQTLVLHRLEREGTWSVKCYTTNHRSRIRGSSLLKFVKENNLQKGDICMFELTTNASQTAFVVHVSPAS